MALTIQNYYGLLIRSRLLAADDAKSLYDRWQKEAKENASDVDRFRRWIVSNRFLTEYQANLLYRGHADDFFLNDYKILDRLGRGRMAGVYKAVHNLGQVVAIKVLPPSKAKDPYMLSRFLREARLAMRLKHPNVVRSYQVGEANKLNYIVMEYLEGETLDDVLYRRKKMAPLEAVRIVYQILKGLQHIQDQGMVHRDLKPSNIMLTPARVTGQPDSTLSATVKVLDIGLGRTFFDENAPSPPDETQLTGDGVLLGTPDYLAPEQARNARGVDIRADIYSLGCVLHHCISGYPPFPDMNILNQIIRHANEKPRRLKEVNAEVSDALQQVIDCMMSKDPDQRYSTPEKAAQALKGFLSPGMEVIRAQDADPVMTKFLMWLDNSPNGIKPDRGIARAPGESGKLPAVKPPESSPPSQPEKKKRKKRKTKRKKVPVAAPVAPPPGVDVELLDKPGKRKKKRSSKKSRRSRSPFNFDYIPRVRSRKVMYISMGLLAILVAIAVGGILASGGVGPFLDKLGLTGWSLK